MNCVAIVALTSIQSHTRQIAPMIASMFGAKQFALRVKSYG